MGQVIEPPSLASNLKRVQKPAVYLSTSIVTARRSTIVYVCRKFPNSTGVEPGATSGIQVQMMIGEPANVKAGACSGNAANSGRAAASLMVNNSAAVREFIKNTLPSIHCGGISILS